jgi:hypothetical protein
MRRVVERGKTVNRTFRLISNTNELQEEPRGFDCIQSGNFAAKESKTSVVRRKMVIVMLRLDPA